MEFKYKEEFWFISTFLNTHLVDGNKKSQEIEKEVKERLNNLKKGEEPECARTTKKGLIKYTDIKEDKANNIIEVNKNLVIKYAPWKKMLKEAKKK